MIGKRGIGPTVQQLDCERIAQELADDPGLGNRGLLIADRRELIEARLGEIRDAMRDLARAAPGAAKDGGGCNYGNTARASARLALVAASFATECWSFVDADAATSNGLQACTMSVVAARADEIAITCAVAAENLPQ